MSGTVVAAAQGIPRIRIGAPGRRTSTRRARISWGGAGDESGPVDERLALALPDARERVDGMFRAGENARGRSERAALAAGWGRAVGDVQELAGKTKFPTASLSAQLRPLRKASYGGG